MGQTHEDHPMEEGASFQELSLKPATEVCDKQEIIDVLAKSASETSENTNEIISIRSETEKGLTLGIVLTLPFLFVKPFKRNFTIVLLKLRSF